MAVYISADVPLELIEWNEANPKFYVTDLAETDDRARSQFERKFVYYAGSHEGCGCGFQVGKYPEYDDDERPLKRESVNRFAAYLEKEIARAGSIDLFACWEGDQELPIEHRRHLSPNILRRDDFFFLQCELSDIRGD